MDIYYVGEVLLRAGLLHSRGFTECKCIIYERVYCVVLSCVGEGLLRASVGESLLSAGVLYRPVFT